jgi:hypothetical protein
VTVPGRVLFVSLSALSVIIVIGVLVLSKYNTRIELIDIDTVTSIEMEQINERNSVGIVEIINQSDIAALLSHLSSARKASLTWYAASDDNPTQPDYLAIRISTKRGGQSLYLYTYGNREYVYNPYIGIYRIKNETSKEIYRLYMSAM